MHLMSHVLRFYFILFFLKEVWISSSHRDRVLFKYQGRLDMSLAELCGHCSQAPLMTVPHLFNQRLGGQSRAEIPSHVLINLRSLRDDVYSLPGQPQDLYCCRLRFAAGFFIICWVLGVLREIGWRGQKEGKVAVVFQILVPCWMSNQQRNHNISLSWLCKTLRCSDLWKS